MTQSRCLPLLIVLLLLTVVAPWPLKAQSAAYEQAVNRADDLVRQGKLVEDLSAAQAAIRLDPRQFKPDYYAAFALYQRDLLEQAKPYAQQALERAPAADRVDVQRLLDAIAEREIANQQVRIGDKAFDQGLLAKAAAYTKAFEASLHREDIGLKKAKLWVGRLDSPSEALSTLSAGVFSAKDFAAIPAGEFMMGGDYGDKAPKHRVRISRGFELGKCEVTQAQWKAVMGSNPSHFKGTNLPVECVSWEEVQQFIERLNEQRDGYLYRLPTEAEWEYACRAGTTGDYAGNLDAMAWYDKNSGNETHPVGQKQPNAWGLYDMHGNVWEWVQDWYDKTYYSGSPATDPRGPSSGSSRVARGGSWYNDAVSCRSALRDYNAPDELLHDLGFRLLRTPR